MVAGSQVLRFEQLLDRDFLIREGYTSQEMHAERPLVGTDPSLFSTYAAIAQRFE